MIYKSIIAGSMIMALGTTAFAHNSFKSEDVLSRGYYPHEFQQLVQESQKGDSVTHWEDVQTIQKPQENDLAASFVKSENKKNPLLSSWIDIGIGVTEPKKRGINTWKMKCTNVADKDLPIQVQQPVWQNQCDVNRHLALRADHAYKIFKKERTLEEATEIAIKNKAGEVEGVVSYHQDENGEGHIAVSYRGTQGWRDWLTNLNFIPVSANPYGISGNVHLGFHWRYQESKDSLMAAVDQLVKKHGVKDIRVAGHSLGGALGTLAAVDLQVKYGPGKKVSLDNFNAPNALDVEAAKIVNKLLPNAQSFTRDGDAVHWVGINIFAYGVVGRIFHLGAKGYNPLYNHKHTHNVLAAEGEDIITPEPLELYDSTIGATYQQPKTTFMEKVTSFFSW